MFNDIGNKIKTLTAVSCWVGIAVFVMVGFALMVLLPDYLILGIVIAVGGALISWLGSFLLYGYGQLIENTDIIIRSITAKSFDNAFETFDGRGQPSFDRKELIYKCQKIDLKSEVDRGVCPLCQAEDVHLQRCIIKTEYGTREMFICKQCIDEFKSSL
ncbi:MAG: hypothetical protein IJO94_07610 [Firmicutes bacterium]|nr:hypothetical protein [Bacillota bacterium]